ncbi:Fe(3+) ABC transporter substrate-binding protein [Kiritimatiellaeota bacterium B1221]|nr:Fe(3+) ABC transporter substrate-binding protein [Kiritimatiellaeota bacterium B1221]
MHIKRAIYTTLFSFAFLFSQAAEPLVIYSHRHYQADEDIYKAFTEQTGIEVQVLKAGANELMERLKAEGETSKADLLLTSDAGRLGEAKALGLFTRIDSEILTQQVPEAYRDPDGTWYGFSMRARVLVYAPDRVDVAGLSSYEALADAAWRGRILARSSNNIYNQSLLASLIAAHGKAEALTWATAVRKNMARPPQGSDRDQIRAVAAGLGDVAIVNTYYLGLLLNSPEPKDRAAAQKVKIFFPNQSGRGTHVNISGGGVLAASKQKANAQKFLEFMVSEDIQKSFPGNTYEYPVVEGIEWSALQKSWGKFKRDPLNLAQLYEDGKEAVRLFNLAGWE